MEREVIFTELYAEKVNNYQEFESLRVYFESWNGFYEVTYEFHRCDIEIFNKVFELHTSLLNEFELLDMYEVKISNISDLVGDNLKVYLRSKDWQLYYYKWVLIHYEGSYEENYLKVVIQ